MRVSGETEGPDEYRKLISFRPFYNNRTGRRHSYNCPRCATAAKDVCDFTERGEEGKLGTDCLSCQPV